jgi:hypothetical protein
MYSKSPVSTAKHKAAQRAIGLGLAAAIRHAAEKKLQRAPWPRFISTWAIRRGHPIHLVVEAGVFIDGARSRSVYWAFVRTHKGWRWTLFSQNSRIVGAATEDFSTKYKAVKNAAFHGCPLWMKRRPWPDGMYVDMVWPSWDFKTDRRMSPDGGLDYAVVPR